MAQVQQRFLVAIALSAVGTLLTPSAEARKFYDDDPLLTVPKPMPVKEVKRRRTSDIYDYFLNTLARPGEKQLPGKLTRAMDTNTLDEIPNGPWYNNRHGKKRMTIEELLRGPNTSPAPSMTGSWEVTAAKTEGVTPGFTIKDSNGRRYQVKFDALDSYELGTGADVMGSKFFWAFGFWVPQNFLVYFPLEQLRVPQGTKFVDKRGQERDLIQKDVDDIMAPVKKDSQGRYRAVASAYLEGSPVGPWKFNGTRTDDPNDTVPHEHLRVLRGMRVFDSWVNHHDSKALNSLDTVVAGPDGKYVRHHLIDFSSTFGAEAFEPKSPRAGYVYLLDWRDSTRTFLTLGLAPAPWTRAHYEHVQGAGRLESKVFDPEQWKPNYYSPAFENMLPDDAFWAAKTIMRFTEPEIRAIMQTCEYSDKEGLEYLIKVMVERQQKIGKTWFSKVLPLDNFRVADGQLQFDDLGQQYGFVPKRDFTIAWSNFDNDSEKKTALATGAQIPRSTSAYIAADIHAGNPSMAVTVYLKRNGDNRELVGIERTWPQESLASRLR